LDTELGDIDYLIEAFLLGLSASEVLEQGAIPGPEVGDTSAGLAIVANLEDIPVRMDMVVFRRDVIGAFALIMYLDGDVPVIPIAEVAGKLDERIIDLLPQINCPLPSLMSEAKVLIRLTAPIKLTIARTGRSSVPLIEYDITHGFSGT